MKISWPFFFSRLTEIICFGWAFWFVRYWVIHYEKKLDAFSTPYDRSLQHSDINFFSILLLVFICGYYLLVYAAREYRKRLISPDMDLLASNSKIIRIRIAALVCMYIAISIVGCTAFGLSDSAAVLIFVVPAFAIGVCLAPYVIFYNLTDIFTLKYCVMVTLSVLAITFVAGYFHFPPTLAFVFTGIPVFAGLTKKYAQADRFMRTGKTNL